MTSQAIKTGLYLRKTKWNNYLADNKGNIIMNNIDTEQTKEFEDWVKKV